MPQKVAMNVSKLQNELHSTSSKDENLEPHPDDTSAEMDIADEPCSSSDKGTSMNPSSDVKQEETDMDIIFPDLFKNINAKYVEKNTLTKGLSSTTFKHTVELITSVINVQIGNLPTNIFQ